MSKTLKRQFQYSKGTSNKFWEISRIDTQVTISFGRIGTAGQTIIKWSSDESKAVKQVQQFISEKTKKGYRENKGVERKSYLATIDLLIDMVDVQKMIATAVQKYAAKHKAVGSAKKHPPVTRIDLNFRLGDSVSTPWIQLDFDTKPGSKPDGDPTHPFFAKLSRRVWRSAVRAVCDDQKVAVVKHNGKTRRCGDAELTETIGNFLVDMLLEARAKGVFAKLPKEGHCELGVAEPSTGDFGWPCYADRGKRNHVK